ncbi:unnamed protein product [Prorocentrum cordatum]|uniref:YrhK domain-containing protein n=1 Tax=Prorocentrum cordatum TaxID=2364126 RepID=A0ABN9WJN4_9DINO|nr:unnamed protein product [Polarella glacialis]
MTPEGWVITADVLFMLGSLIFACAAYLNALGINRAHEGPFANFKVLRKYALMTTTCFAFGAFTFIAGTMCFIPAKYIATPTVADHGTCTVSMAAMEKLGCCFYGVGSLLYLLGACISFARALVEHKMEVEHEERAALIQQHVKEFVEKKHRKKVSEFADTSYKKRVDRLPDSIKDMAKHCVLRQRCKLQEMAEAEECAELAPLFWGQAEDDMMSAAESLEDEKDIFGTIKLILWGTPEGVEAECDRLQERGFWTLAWSGVRERVYGRPRQVVDVRPWLPSKGALAEPLTGSR